MSRTASRTAISSTASGTAMSGTAMSTAAHLVRQWRALPAALRDSVGVAVLAVLVFSSQLSQIGIVIGELPERRLDGLGVLAEVAMWFPLALRRRSPALALALVGAGFALHELLGYPPTATTLGLYVAVYSAGAHLLHRRPEVALAATAGSAALAAGLLLRGSPNGPDVFASGYVVLVACWQFGAWIRRRQLAEEERRRLSVHAAIQAERARIARELHDVVTHHVTAMVVQADAAQYVAGAGPSEVVTGLAAISDTGRRALGDLRHLLGVLTADPDDAAGPGAGEDGGGRPGRDLSPAPGRIGELVDRIRRTGQPVELVEDDARPGPGAADPGSGDPGAVHPAIYRVAQEALTNALKHATGAATTVRLRHDAGGTEIEVTTQSPARSRGPAGPARITGSGRGLAGLRERVRQEGGELSSGPTADGGFRVWARIETRATTTTEAEPVTDR
jgi:signal transduction histidine kinase